MRNRTIILVSHHVQLCAPGASYIVALDNGRVQFQGGQQDFLASDVLKTLSQSTNASDPADEKEETLVHTIEEVADKGLDPSSSSSSTSIKNGKEDDGNGDSGGHGRGEGSEGSSETVAPATGDAHANGQKITKIEKKAPRKLIEEEKRAVGRIGKDIWVTYIQACGSAVYWSMFGASLIVAAGSPVLENWWLK